MSGRNKHRRNHSRQKYKADNTAPDRAEAEIIQKTGESLPAATEDSPSQTEEAPKHLGISFSMKRRRVSVGMETLEVLGDPDHIRLLVNKKEKRIAVQSCEMIDRDCYRISWKEVDKEHRFEIASIKFLGLLYKISNWDDEKSYRIQGYLVKNYHLVLFLLDEAEEITEEEFDNGEK